MTNLCEQFDEYRSLFHFPVIHGKQATYFCGNSLGLQPTTAEGAVLAELADWKKFAVEGHFHARNPWFSYHRMFAEGLGMIVGGLPHEVVAMNTLTVNLHLMMTTFYRPTASRYKIIIAGNEFPSDRYAVESQVRMHGFSPADAMIEIAPREGEYILHQSDIERAIREHGETVALVLFSGVHFFTGQFFDIAAIASVAHEIGAYAGFDLAHAVGNVELKLHDWDVDFAVWCSYKYLNSGPGGVGGAFVHERFASRADLPRLAGWWGNEEASRFSMSHGFVPTYGVDGWQLSNAQILPMAAHKASLDIFVQAGWECLNKRRVELTSLLETIVNEAIGDSGVAEIITPRNTAQRGAQLSVLFHQHGRQVFERLIAEGIIVDWRTPNVIRITPAPLYNSVEDIQHFGRVFGAVLHELTTSSAQMSSLPSSMTS